MISVSVNDQTYCNITGALQAQDRAHRIGQTREVRVLRLTCANTMEEDILERTTYKKELGGAAIDGGMFNDQSTIEDRHAFLRKIFSRFEGRMVYCDTLLLSNLVAVVRLTTVIALHFAGRVARRRSKFSPMKR